MKKKLRLKVCDTALALCLIITLVSAIQLEATGSSGTGAVWFHIMVSIVFMALVVWHLYLHFKWKEWARKLLRQKSPVTRWMTVFGLITVISAAVATAHWLTVPLHSPAGAVHGKFGFVFLILAAGHTIKRFRFFTR